MQPGSMRYLNISNQSWSNLFEGLNNARSRCAILQLFSSSTLNHLKLWSADHFGHDECTQHRWLFIIRKERSLCRKICSWSVWWFKIEDDRALDFYCLLFKLLQLDLAKVQLKMSAQVLFIFMDCKSCDVIFIRLGECVNTMVNELMATMSVFARFMFFKG